MRVVNFVQKFFFFRAPQGCCKDVTTKSCHWEGAASKTAADTITVGAIRVVPGSLRSHMQASILVGLEPFLNPKP